MVLAGLSFLFVGAFQAILDSGHPISVAWQFIPYLIITCSEVMVSITGLEFAYTQAPRSMKSTIMSFWLITVFIGNLLDAYIAKLNVFQGALFFYFFAALMFLVSLIFIVSASRYRVKNHLGTSNSLATA
jgi:POT family proton-dependent oligopeptide transporter